MSPLFVGKECVFVVHPPSERGVVTYEQYCLATGEVGIFRSPGAPPFAPHVRRATDEEHRAWDAMQKAIADARDTFRACIDCAREPTHEDMERALLDAGWDSSCAGGLPSGRSWRAPPGHPKHGDGAYRLTRDAWALLTRPS